jgi:heme-degrading monooxygenase HmoA
MICYSIRLLKILPDKADHVVRALRQEGLFAELKKEIPGHIGCSILESDLTNDLYLVIDFWQSKYDYFEAKFRPAVSS